MQNWQNQIRTYDLFPKRWLLSRFVLLFLMTPLVFHAPDVPASNGHEETVHFSTATAPPTPFQVKRLGNDARNPPGPEMVGVLALPDTEEPVPAVVLVMPCYGDHVFRNWMSVLTEWGYATFRFTRCGQKAKIYQGPLHAYDWKEGAEAAFGALNYLALRPEIDASRIAVMSWSRFGMVPLSVLNEAGFAQFHERSFRTAIAFYPICSFARGPHDGPILVLTAAADDWISSPICQRLGRKTTNDQHPVNVVVFEGAYQGFDLPAFGPPEYREKEINPDGFNAKGRTMGYDSDAHKRAVRLVREHLSRHLGK